MSIELSQFDPRRLEKQRTKRGPPTILFLGSRGSGKCLGKDTPVMMYDGTIKKVQDIRPGDELMGDDSTPRNVLSTVRGISTMYTVEQQYGDPYTVNENHILSLLDEKNKIDISITDYIDTNPRLKIKYRGYKRGVNFKHSNVCCDPHKFGMEFVENPHMHTGNLLVSSIQCRIQLLTGILHGMGYYDLYDEITFMCNDQYLSNVVKYLVDTTGLRRSSISENVYRIHTGSLFRRNYSDVFNPVETAISVRCIGRGEYYGFHLDGNHRFLLGDCTVTHNSYLAKDIIGYLRKIPTGLMMSGTEAGKADFEGIFPSEFIHGDFKPEVVSSILKSQKKKTKKEPKRSERTKDIDTILFLEDCMAEPKHFRSPVFRDIFKNGRHFGICLLMTMQYCMDITPDLRSQIDYVFMTREIMLNIRKKVYDNFFSMVTYKEFNEILTKVTANHGILVLDKTDDTGLPKNMLFHYKARSPPKQYRIGTESFWQLNDDIVRKKIMRKKAKKKRQKENNMISITGG
jgi:hypothetical protein